MPEPGPDGVRYRRPTEADHVPIVRLIDDWWGGGPGFESLDRLWLQHFTGTSWLAEVSGARIGGFLVGFLSADHPDTACCRLVGMDPNLRRQGIGRALYDRFVADARAAGRSRIVATVWPGNHGAIAFHLALGFELLIGPGTQNLYGTPAYPAYDHDREDRSVLVRRI